MKTIIAIVLSVTAAGCGATEATRRVNVHNRLAAEWIAGVSDSPEIDEAATLIAAGSVVLEAELGTPEAPPLVYDKVKQREDIEIAKREIEAKAGLLDTVWNFAQTTAGKITGVLGLGALGVTIIGWFRSAAWSGKLWQYSKTVGSVIEKYKGMRAEVAAKAQARGVSKEVHAVVEELPISTAPVPAVVAPASAPDPEVVVESPKPTPAKP